MIPHELSPRSILLPEGEASIVIMTCRELRSERFALRLQQEFGTLVKGWFVYTPTQHASVPDSRTKPAASESESRLSRLRRMGFQELARKSLGWAKRKLGGIIRRVRGNPEAQKKKASQTLWEETERHLFEMEVERLRKYQVVDPESVSDPNSEEFVSRVREIDPYFFLSLGGPLYGKQLLATARGIALNQHAGWSPDHRGSGTVHWALYHRDLLKVGSTVHVTSSGADAGPIVRRGQTGIVPWDTAESMFLRTVALGTELMCEVVHDAMTMRQLTVFDQPPYSGKTYTYPELTPDIVRSIEQDIEAGWLVREMRRLRSF